MTAVLLTASKTVNVDMHSDVYESIWYDNRCYCSLHFDTSLTDLDLDSKSQECATAKTSEPITSQSFQSI